MLINLDDKIIPEKIGNKAKYLMVMRNNGFRVPNGFILDSDTLNEIIAFNNKEQQIAAMMSDIKQDNIELKSASLQLLFDELEIPQTLTDSIHAKIKDGTRYAIRSSGIKEDLENFSFAGQYLTFLNATGLDNIKKAIIACYQSMYSETILTYLVHNNLGTENLEMAVVVQEMVGSKKAELLLP